MNKRERAGRCPANLSDSDLLLHWAAEEFVAAGRAEAAEERRTHRERALFFAEVLHGLSFQIPAQAEPAGESSAIGELLHVAYGPSAPSSRKGA